MIENPPLDEDLLIHFGIKGMKWGKRKVRPDEAERKKLFAKGSRSRKVAIGAAAVGGALAISYLMTKRGQTKIADMAVSQYTQTRVARAQAGNNPFGNLAKKFRDTKAASIPSPAEMTAQARMAGVRDRVFKGGSQKLTDQAWRDQARLSQLSRSMSDTTNDLLNGNLSALVNARKSS